MSLHNFQETTLDRVSKANHKQMKVCLRTVYHVVKMLSFPGKKPFCKAILRMVDKKQNGLFLEVTGNNEQEVQKKLQPYVAHSCTMVAGLLVVQNSKWLAGYSATVGSAAQAKVFVMPVAAAHPTAMALQSLCPVAKSNIGELTSHCQGPVRADIVGLLTHVEIAPTAKPKATLWLKGESKEEIAISAWGSRMVSAARDMKVGQLAQIDNCLLHKKLDGSVEGSCEDFLDSDRHSFSHLTTDVAGERAERLRQLDCDRGHAISTPWSLQALRMKTDGSEKYVSCAATVAACPLTMQDRAPGAPCLQLGDSPVVLD